MKRILGSGASKEEQVQLVWELLQEKPPEPQDEDSSLRLVWERIFVDLAWAAVDKIDEGAERTFRLYTLVLSVRPSKATQKFLGRLGRCYIWGFESECVMLCRSVSDTAFHEAINDEVCEQQFGKHHGEFTLGDRILAAQKEGMIDEAAYNLAIGVKVRGNKAVHCQPDITQDILATIRDTLTVLEKLHKRK